MSFRFSLSPSLICLSSFSIIKMLKISTPPYVLPPLLVPLVWSSMKMFLRSLAPLIKITLTSFSDSITRAISTAELSPFLACLPPSYLCILLSVRFVIVVSCEVRKQRVFTTNVKVEMKLISQF